MWMQNALRNAGRFEQGIILQNTSDLVMEQIYPAYPRGEKHDQLHLHPRQDEHFKVLEGILSVRIAAEERTYVAGEAFKIRRGLPHLTFNQAGRPARVLWRVQPALNTAEFINAIHGMSRGGRIASLLQGALIAWTYRDIFLSASPPPWIQPVILAPLALAGKLLGYQDSYQ